jgi:hypothetical protein
LTLIYLNGMINGQLFLFLRNYSGPRFPCHREGRVLEGSH